MTCTLPCEDAGLMSASLRESWLQAPKHSASTEASADTAAARMEKKRKAAAEAEPVTEQLIDDSLLGERPHPMPVRRYFQD